MEEVVASQLIAHLSTPFDQFKSECRCKHFTEIALIRVVSDLLIAMDSYLTICPVFDTEDQKVPLDLLEDFIVLEGLVVVLSDSPQCDMWNSSVLQNHRVKYGVPQGSVLDLLLFSVSASPWSHLQ